MLAVESWLDSVLSAALLSSSKGVKDLNAPVKGGLKSFEIDRESLSNFGVSRESQDKVYRAFFVYSKGIHDSIRQVTHSSNPNASVVAIKCWTAFTRILEFCEPNHAEMLLQDMQRNQHEAIEKIATTYSNVLAQKEELQELLTTENTKLKLTNELLEHQVESMRTSTEIVVNSLNETVRNLSWDMDTTRVRNEQLMNDIRKEKNGFAELKFQHEKLVLLHKSTEEKLKIAMEQNNYFEDKLTRVNIKVEQYEKQKEDDAKEKLQMREIMNNQFAEKQQLFHQVVANSEQVRLCNLECKKLQGEIQELTRDKTNLICMFDDMRCAADNLLGCFRTAFNNFAQLGKSISLASNRKNSGAVINMFAPLQSHSVGHCTHFKLANDIDTAIDNKKSIYSEELDDCFHHNFGSCECMWSFSGDNPHEDSLCGILRSVTDYSVRVIPEWSKLLLAEVAELRKSKKELSQMQNYNKLLNTRIAAGDFTSNIWRNLMCKNNAAVAVTSKKASEYLLLYKKSQAEISNMYTDKSKVQEKIKGIERERDKLLNSGKEIDFLRKKLEETQGKNKILRDDIEKKDNQVSELIADITQLHVKIEAHDELVREKNNQLFELRNEVSNCKAALELNTRASESNIYVVNQLLGQILSEYSSISSDIPRDLLISRKSRGDRVKLMRKNLSEVSLFVSKTVDSMFDKKRPSTVGNPRRGDGKVVTFELAAQSARLDESKETLDNYRENLIASLLANDNTVFSNDDTDIFLKLANDCCDDIWDLKQSVSHWHLLYTTADKEKHEAIMELANFKSYFMRERNQALARFNNKLAAKIVEVEKKARDSNLQNVQKLIVHNDYLQAKLNLYKATPFRKNLRQHVKPTSGNETEHNDGNYIEEEESGSETESDSESEVSVDNVGVGITENEYNEIENLKTEYMDAIKVQKSAQKNTVEDMGFNEVKLTDVFTDSFVEFENEESEPEILSMETVCNPETPLKVEEFIVQPVEKSHFLPEIVPANECLSENLTSDALEKVSKLRAQSLIGRVLDTASSHVTVPTDVKRNTRIASSIDIQPFPPTGRPSKAGSVALSTRPHIMLRYDLTTSGENVKYIVGDIQTKMKEAENRVINESIRDIETLDNVPASRIQAPKRPIDSSAQEKLDMLTKLLQKLPSEIPDSDVVQDDTVEGKLDIDAEDLITGTLSEENRKLRFKLRNKFLDKHKEHLNLKKDFISVMNSGLSEDGQETGVGLSSTVMQLLDESMKNNV